MPAFVVSTCSTVHNGPFVSACLVKVNIITLYTWLHVAALSKLFAQFVRIIIVLTKNHFIDVSPHTGYVSEGPGWRAGWAVAHSIYEHTNKPTMLSLQCIQEYKCIHVYEKSSHMTYSPGKP